MSAARLLGGEPLRLIAVVILALDVVGSYIRCDPAIAAATRLTANDAMVLADVDNRTGDAVFDHSLKQALALELGQSPFINLTSDRKLREALHSLGRQPNEKITIDGGPEVCLRSGSIVLVVGSVSSLNAHYVVKLRAVSCGTGAILAEESGEAATTEDVLKVLHRTSSGLRAKLGEPVDSQQRFDTPVTATTQSLEVLNNYSLGVTVRREQGDGPSIAYLKKASELDPTFPLAYAELAAIYRNLRQPSLALDYASKAYRLRDRLSEREKLHMASTYFLVTGEVDKEIPIYERWEAIYPRDYIPYNNLGNAYAALGELDKSLTDYQKALRLLPSVVSYTNVVGMEITLYRLDEAQAVFKQAFTSNFDGGYLHQNLYWLAFLRGDAALMAQQLAWAAGKPGDEDALLSIQSDTEAFGGRLGKARMFTQRAVESAERAGLKETAALWQVNAALRDAEVGDVVTARQEVASAMALSSGRDVKLMSAFTLARSNDAGRARRLVEELEKSYPTDTLMKRYWLPAIHASIDLDREHYTEALGDLKEVAPYEMGNAGMFINYLYPAYLRGDAYLRAHDGAAAASEFQKLLDHRGIVSNFVTAALVHLQLGRAYALAGKSGAAKAAYQEFFALWKDADPTAPILVQAKAEYSKLFS